MAAIGGCTSICHACRVRITLNNLDINPYFLRQDDKRQRRMANTSPQPQSAAKGPLKTPRHTLIRVRNNQRRHRAKVREHIANLEARVKDLEYLLNETEKRSQELQKELNWCRDRETKRRSCAESGDNYQEEEATSHRPIQVNSNTNCNPASATVEACPSRRSSSGKHNDSIRGILSFSDDATWAERTSRIQEACSNYPKPTKDESTTLCSEAYATIATQNVRDIDDERIERLLCEGFRAARRKGEGCRVVNWVLMDALNALDSLL